MSTYVSTYDQSLSSFAPELLKHVLTANSEPINAPYVKTFESVGLFADVSGFTKATESLANGMGDLGTEILAHKINSYLPQIAKKIVGSGGDVVKFAGDALICVWPPPPETILNEYEFEYKKIEKIWRKHTEQKKNRKSEKFEEIKKKYLQQKYKNETSQKECLKKNTFAAIQCAIEIQQQFGSMDLSVSLPATHVKRKKRKRKKQEQKVMFRVKLGIGIGKIHLLIVGGALGRCEYLICGDGLIQAFDCENDCSPKENRMIVISGKVISKLGISVIRDNFVIKKVVDSLAGNYEIVSINKKSKNRCKIARAHYGHLVPDMSNNLANKLTSYVPAAVKPHLDMPQQIWTGELREVTILFVSLPWNAQSFAKFTNQILDELQYMIYTLQTVIYKYQGSLNKFIVDDKGSTVMCVFGLPPVAHENDPARAVLAALELREKIGKKKQPSAIGISCGTVFVGIIGSKGVRREYGILGDKVNLSARLMGLSKKNPVKFGEVIVDESVHARARKEIRIEWTDLGWIWVKGKMDKVHIWRPSTNNIPISPFKIGQAVYLETSDKLSLKHINDEIHKYKNVQKEKSVLDGTVILVEGENGIGKSSLLGQIQVRNQKNIWFLWGKANEFHECYDIEYIVWKQILLAFSSRFSLITTKNRYLFSLYIRERRADLFGWLFLINDLINLGNYKLLESEFMPVQYSFKNKNKMDSCPSWAIVKYRHDIIFVLLEWVARIKPIAIIIDEIEFLTTKDWQITRRLCCLVKKKIVKNLIVFLGSTPIDNQRYRPLFKSDSLINKFTEIRLKYTHKVITPRPWGLNETKFFIRKYLDIGHISERVVMSVHSQCGGRPGLVEHFLSELVSDNGQQYLQISNKNDHSNSSDRNELYGSFMEELDNRFKIGLDVSFPIPSYIMSITLSHCDKCNAEQSFILKLASVICKSKGNNSVQFEEHMLRGCHPLPETGMNGKQRLRTSLSQLCDMKFIRKLKNVSGNSMAGAAHTKNIPSYNNFNIDLEELKKKEEKDRNRKNYTDLTDFDGITDPMPATKALLQEPSKYLPYKRGKMYKRGVNFINMTETQRIFVFKHRTLYWIKDESEEYPRSRIKFDESVQKLKREDMRSCSIKTPIKEYILRCQNKKDMDQWFRLFKQALTSNYLSDSMMARMTQRPKPKPKPKGKAKKSKGVSFKDDNDNGCDLSDDVNDEEDIVNQLKQMSSAHNIAPQLLLLDSNDSSDLIGPQSCDCMFEFSYGFLRDVVYKQMLHNQRKQLHTNALKYIAKCLKHKNDDRLALLHTRHIEYVHRYSDMLQGDDSQKQAFQPKRQSFFGRKARN